MSPSRKPTLRRRTRNHALVGLALVLMGVANGPVVGKAADTAVTDYKHSRPDYMAKYGKWDTVELPEGFRARAIHSAMLYTGDVLLVAGSGNDQKSFDAGTFETVLWNPVTGKAKHIHTPTDLFCGGHAYLPNGNLLVAGGTKKYEVLPDKVKAAAGVITLRDEADNGGYDLPKGTRFTGPNGLKYRSTEKVHVPGAHQMEDYTLMAGSADVWIQAEDTTKDYTVGLGKRFTVTADSPAQSKNRYGLSSGEMGISFKKQDYQGIDASYIYDVKKEEYVKTVGKLTTPRWYPTLVSMNGGNVLAVSGLDGHGQIINGNNEVYEQSTGKWYDKEALNRFFPTYPQLFRLKDGRMFYSGANTGYGSTSKGRQPGIWDLTNNKFQKVTGLREPELNETATSFLLPPAQDQKVAFVGGGEDGEGPISTGRMDVTTNLMGKDPKYMPGMDMPRPARYFSAVSLPNDTTLITGGSSDYRGEKQSDLHQSRLYDTATGKLAYAAPNEIGRDYHSSALLLPDGRVMTMGSDPLFSDKEGKMPGVFETRIEIYTPPYLHTGTPRPVIDAAPSVVKRGTTFRVKSTSKYPIVKARLMRPSAVSHQMDTEQRSVAVDVSTTGDCLGTAESCCEGGGCDLDLSLAKPEGLTPSGPYMLMLVDSLGVPSKAAWVRVE